MLSHMAFMAVTRRSIEKLTKRVQATSPLTDVVDYIFIDSKGQCHKAVPQVSQQALLTDRRERCADVKATYDPGNQDWRCCVSYHRLYLCRQTFLCLFCPYRL